MVLALAVLAVTVPITALAYNTHNVDHWYHGLGDGKNNDDYIHVFNDLTDSHKRKSRIIIKHYTDYSLVTDFRKTCDWANHCHRSWDTSPRPECRYETRHYSPSSDHPLNAHDHRHHNFCV